MNARLKELVKDAWDYDTSSLDEVLLAQLIVQECVSVILEWKSEPFPMDPEFAAKLIKEHFGVK